jgi:hypothetical protein
MRHSNLFFMPDTWLKGLGSTKIATLRFLVSGSVLFGSTAAGCTSALLLTVEFSFLLG